MNKRGFTLVEIMVAAFLLALVTTGLAYVFFAARRHLAHTRSKIQAVELGRLFLAPLQMQVREDTWNTATNALSNTGIGSYRYCDSVPGHAAQQQPNCPSLAERTLDGIEYSARYEINPHPQNANIRKVVTTIAWNEPAP